MEEQVRPITRPAQPPASGTLAAWRGSKESLERARTWSPAARYRGPRQITRPSGSSFLEYPEAPLLPGWKQCEAREALTACSAAKDSAGAPDFADAVMSDPSGKTYASQECATVSGRSVWRPAWSISILYRRGAGSSWSLVTATCCGESVEGKRKGAASRLDRCSAAATSSPACVSMARAIQLSAKTLKAGVGVYGSTAEKCVRRRAFGAVHRPSQWIPLLLEGQSVDEREVPADLQVNLGGVSRRVLAGGGHKHSCLH